MRAPEQIETERLRLCRPRSSDAVEIFSRYASNPEAAKYVGFPVHRSLDDTYSFISSSDSAWREWPAGPYLVRSRTDGTLLGSTGLHFETFHRAMTGYIFAEDAWGKGYATEALQAMVNLAARVEIRRLYAICHTAHDASWKVLEKCGFEREGILRSYMEFPNLKPGELFDVFCYARVFRSA